jgi:Domain of unknown function (DUF5658)
MARWGGSIASLTSVEAVVARVRSVSLVELAAAFTIAQLADLATALLVARELNPIAAAITEQPLLGLALKLGLVAFVVAVAEICDRDRPGIARVVLVVGALAGFAGALSNTHLTPFVGS